jgi:hypothetical protein
MTSKHAVSSWSISSKLTGVPSLNFSARHSMLKVRLGAVPLTEVKMPSFTKVKLSVRRSPWNGRIARFTRESGNGQEGPNGAVAAPNSKLPFEEAWTRVPAG